MEFRKETLEKMAEVEDLIKKGMTREKACKQVQLSTASYSRITQQRGKTKPRVIDIPVATHHGGDNENQLALVVGSPKAISYLMREIGLIP